MALVNPYLQVDGLTKRIGDRMLFEHISFGIAEGQRVGLIAKNGTGKSTLLNIIGGKDGYDEGSVVFRRDLNVGYLEQAPSYPPDLTVIEACFSHGNAVTNLIREYENCMNTPGNPRLEEILDRMEREKAWDYENRAKQILSQLKIHSFNQKISTLSGGQLKRVALANVLITEPDLLILDEVLDAERLGFLPEDALRKLTGEAAPAAEVVVTGRGPAPWLLEAADYVTHMVKEKHPYDRGIAARRGVEY